MNDEIEREIISILLNNENKIETVLANDEWFLVEDYRALFQALKSVGNSDTLNVYGKYHELVDNPKPFSFIREVGDTPSFVSQLDRNVSDLRTLYLNHKLQKAVVEWQQNPYQDSENRLREILDIKNDVQESTDDGSLTEVGNELIESLEHPKPRGVKTFEQLDEVLGGGMYGSMLFTIGARPSTGKTAFAVNLAYEAMHHDSDVRVDIFTLEMNKQEMLNRFVSRATGVSSSMLRSKADELNNTMKQIVLQGIKDLNRANLRVYDGMEYLNEIINVIRQNAAKAKRGKYLAIIDYIGLIKVLNAKDRYLEVGETTRELKRLTNEVDIPIVALSQLSRGIEQRQDKTPLLSDLRESGSIEQDSNVVAFLHRPHKANDVQLVQLSIRKNREGELGNIDFNFIGEEMKFQELKS